MATNEEGIRYLRENFQASDWLAVFLQNQSGHIIQRFTTAQRLAESDVQAWLDYKNLQGYKVCVSMNALTPGVESRRKQDVAMIRHLYVDVDHHGPQVLRKIMQSEKTPTPNYVLETSPGKYQVIWKVEGIAKAHAEVLLKGLAQESSPHSFGRSSSGNIATDLPEFCALKPSDYFSALCTCVISATRSRSFRSRRDGSTRNFFRRTSVTVLRTEPLQRPPHPAFHLSDRAGQSTIVLRQAWHRS